VEKLLLLLLLLLIPSASVPPRLLRHPLRNLISASVLGDD
jgi:hypothetical protein